MTLDTHELAWAAGFIDGEGWFGQTIQRVRPTDQRDYAHIKLTVSQCDPRALFRLRHALALGTVLGPYSKQNTNCNPVWVYHINGFNKTQAAIALLWRWLCPIKREQAKQTLLDWHTFNNRPKLSLGPKPRIPDCHPDQKHAGHGLCCSCYHAKRYKESHAQ